MKEVVIASRDLAAFARLSARSLTVALRQQAWLRPGGDPEAHTAAAGLVALPDANSTPLRALFGGQQHRRGRTTMTATTKVDRDKLAGELKALASEHLGRLEPLTAEVTAAEAAHAGAAEVLDGAARSVREARLAVTVANNDHGRARGPIERALRDDVAAKLAEFRVWCRGQAEYLRGAPEKRVPDREARAQATVSAVQSIERLSLLSDDALDQRLAALRAEIGDEAVAAS